MQIPLPQSPLYVQVWPGLHVGPQFGPPQSMSVSRLFKMPSAQLGGGGWQTLPVQTMLLQSPFTTHESPTWQRTQLPPPQSTSDSF